MADDVTIELLAKSLAGNLEMLKTHLADFSDDDMMVRPVPGANHAAWQVGHLLAFEAMLCGLYAQHAAPNLPGDPQKTYGAEGSKSDDAALFLKKDDALKLLEQTRG